MTYEEAMLQFKDRIIGYLSEVGDGEVENVILDNIWREVKGCLDKAHQTRATVEEAKQKLDCMITAWETAYSLEANDLQLSAVHDLKEIKDLLNSSNQTEGKKP